MLENIFKINSKAEASYDLENIHNYFWNGCYINQFKASPQLDRLNNILASIYHNDLKEGYEMVSKYPYTKDLRPNVYTYDTVFTDILIENEVPQLLEKVTGQDLVLSHIQLRIAYPSPSGYMEWHRDTHFYNKDGKASGNVPPAHKIIYYPKIDIEESVLEILPGSNLRYVKDTTEDLAQIKKHKKEIVRVNNSNENFLLFNTFTLHSTLPTTIPEGAIRLIYSFIHRFQLSSYKEQEELHKLYADSIRKYTAP